MVEINGTGSVAYSGNDLSASRDYSKYIDWIKTEFMPIQLATSDDTIKQCIENAIRYWNTHSGYRWIEMASMTGNNRADVSANLKTIVSVYPSTDNNVFLDGHPLWSLLGISVIENVTSDLIIMSEAFKNYKYYLGSEMRWTYIKSEDPATGGYLLIQNAPASCSTFAVVGTKRILNNEDIKQEYILNWLLYYTKALVKQVEGNTLRKANVINAPNDGQELVNEGKEEMKDLQEQLAKDGRWVTLARRF